MQEQGDRVIVELVKNTNERDLYVWLDKLSYFFEVPICKQVFIDLTSNDIQREILPLPLDLYPERPQGYLANMADKVAIPSGKTGVLGVLVYNDPRRPGEKIYRTVLIFWKKNKTDFEQKVSQFQKYLEKKGTQQ